jgi:hypothetical protein
MSTSHLPDNFRQTTPWLMALVTALLLCLFFWPLANGQIYTGSDLGALHLPLRAFYMDALKAGEAPLWEPRIACGFPALAEGQFGAVHPVHFFLYRFLPLWLGLQFELLIAYLGAFSGALLLLRYLRFEAVPAWFAAAGFAFSIYMITHFPHANMIAVFAHLPWLLWLILKLFDAGTNRTRLFLATWIAVLLASQMLTGHPPAMFASGVVWGSVALYLAWSRRCRQAFGMLAIAVGLMFLLSAAQWLPTLLYLPLTERADLAAAYVNDFSLHPANFLQLPGPYLFRGGTVPDAISGASRIEFPIYPGLGVVGLALLGVLRTGELPTSQRRLIRVALLLIVVVGLFMCGRYGGINSLTAHIPLIQGFRCPSRYIAIWQLLWLGLALAGLDWVRRRPNRKIINGGWLALMMVVVLVHLMALAAPACGPAWLDEVHTGGALWRSAAISVAIVLIGWWSCLGRSWRTTAFAACCLIDVGVNGYYQMLHAMPRRDISAINTDVANRAGVDRRYRVVKRFNDGVLRGEYNMTAYAAIEPSRTYDAMDNSTMALLGVQQVKMQGTTWQVTNVVPRFRLVRRTAALRESPKAGFAGIDFADVVLLPGNEAELAVEKGTLEVLEDAPSAATVTVRGRDRQILVVSDRWDPDWVCTIDGEVVPILKAYGIVRCVIVPPGEHRVEFLYDPPGWAYGKLLSLAGLIVLLALLAMTWPRLKSLSADR